MHEPCVPTLPTTTSRSWTPHRVRGDTMRIGGREALSSFRAATRNPGVPARDYVNKSPACSLWTPHRVRGDTMRIGDGEALSSFRAATRNPEIPARYNSGRTSRASLLLPLPPPEAGPRIGVRVTHYVHSSLQREERTKKRRRCYRAISFGDWRRLRGLRNSLRSDSPRPHSSVGWPPPGPIKAGVPLLYTENDPDVLQHNIQGYTGLSRHSALRRGFQNYPGKI